MANSRIITDRSEFENALSDLNSGRSIPFRGPAWLGPWVDSFLKDESRLHAIAIADGSTVIGLAPLFLGRSVTNGSVLRFLGDGTVCTDYSTILVARPDLENEVVTAIARQLQESELEWDKIVLDGVAADDTTVARFTDLFASSKGNTVTVEEGMRCWRLQLPGSWDDLLAMLSKSHRKQVRRVQKRIVEHASFEATTADTIELVDHGVELLIDLHQRRWESRGESGCFASDSFRGFIKQAAHALFAKDQLQLTWICFEGTPIAVDFNLVSPEGIFAYQGGISPDHLDLQPGRAMNIVSIMSAIEKKKQFVDFLRGDEEYKPHWRATPAPTRRFTIVPNRLLSRARHNLLQFGKELKKTIRGKASKELPN